MKSNQKLSRSPAIDMEKCIENAGGRFDLVRVAVAKARQIANQHMRDGHTTEVNAPVTALLEIQEGKIDPELLRKP